MGDLFPPADDLAPALLCAGVVILSLFGAGLATGWLIWG